MENVCKFIPPNKTADHIQPINFVLETNTATPVLLSPCTVYRMHLVTSGEGEIKCGDTTKRVKRGDIFFAFPAVMESITSIDNFRYMYISYIGIRAGAEMERFGINYKNFVFENFEELYPFWSDALASSPELIDLASESVLLFTLSRIGNRSPLKPRNAHDSSSDANFLLMKKYIDENFANPSLSCEMMAEHFCYNKKYISTLFKKNFQLGITEYINTVRINNACALIEDGYRSVNDLAAAVGFHDALYFSRVFKKKTGCSPREFMIGQ